MMPFHFERFALSRCLYEVHFISVVDVHFSDAQQQTLGVFEKDELLQEIEQQHIELVVRELDLACLARLNRLDVVDHHVRRRINSVAKQFRQIAPGRLKSDVGRSDFLQISVGHGQRMTKSECRMTNELRMTNCRASVSDARAFHRNALPSFVLSHSFDIRHSYFVIFRSAFIKRAQNGLFFGSDVPPDKHQFRAIGFKWLQFPAAGHEIEKLPAIGEADETLAANDPTGQASCKFLETSARKNLVGSECERFEFMLMQVFQACDFSLASNSKQQFRINPASVGANDCRVRIDFSKFRFERLDLQRLDQIDLVQEQNVCGFDLQTSCVAQFRKTNKHVGVDD